MKPPAQVAYEAWVRSFPECKGGRSPAWRKLSLVTRNAWRVAAVAATEAYLAPLLAKAKKREERA